MRVNTRQGIKAEATDAGQREAWNDSRAVSSGGRQRGLDSIPNHPPIHAPVFVLFFVVMPTDKRHIRTHRNANLHTLSKAVETDAVQLPNTCSGLELAQR